MSHFQIFPRVVFIPWKLAFLPYVFCVHFALACGRANTNWLAQVTLKPHYKKVASCTKIGFVINSLYRRIPNTTARFCYSQYFVISGFVMSVQVALNASQLRCLYCAERRFVCIPNLSPLFTVTNHWSLRSLIYVLSLSCPVCATVAGKRKMIQKWNHRHYFHLTLVLNFAEKSMPWQLIFNIVLPWIVLHCTTLKPHYNEDTSYKKISLLHPKICYKSVFLTL